MTELPNLRPSPIAGLWYSGDREVLSKQVDDYLASAQIPQLNGEVVALIAPHAGLKVSGRTAAHAFRAVMGKSYDLVAVVAPFHAFHPATMITSAHQAYSNPIGPVWIDQEAVSEVDRQLRQNIYQGLTPIANDGEHSLEIELPFLQRALADPFKLLPIMLRGRSSQVIKALGQSLKDVFSKRRGLLVASTDLSHFYPQPVADTLDNEMLNQIQAFSPEGVLNAERTGTGFACGSAAVAAVMWAARELGANAVELVHHSTSGDESGDYNSVVGYGAAIILKRP
ncbi:MAG: AmmeMemoRadiSam system protein B [Anaerolineaceae bacterium]|nr:AmmeMemoRadiSam system protein B [Anaerolineaceae bacterium]